MPNRNGVGLFARAFIEQFPLIPVEEEGRLCEPTLRENFIERVFCYRRWQDLVQSGVTRRTLVQFHTIHKYLLLAHSPQQYEVLGRLVGQAEQHRPKELAHRYGELFMKTLAVKDNGAQARERAPAHTGVFQGAARRSRESRAIGSDR